MVRLKLLLYILTLCIGLNAHAVIMLFSDYDNTITKDREDGNWVTLYELHRVHSTALSAIPIPLDQPHRILISHKDWQDYEQYFSPGDGQTGHMLPVSLYHGETLRGEKIESFVPGFYQVVASSTFTRYRGDEYFDSDVEKPKNYWREDRKKAMEKTKQGNGTHIGYGYDLATHFLKDPYLAAGFRLVTFRGYPDEAILEIFEDMKNDKEIKYLPLVNPNGKPLAFWALSHPQFANRWSNKDLAKKKASVLIEAANQLRMTPPSEKVLNPDGTAEDFYHTFIIQEDNVNYLKSLVKAAQEITRRGSHFIKFVIRHAGSQEEIEANNFYVMNGQKKKYVRDIVIRSDGSFREAKKEEMFIDGKTAKISNERLMKSCERVLARGK